MGAWGAGIFQDDTACDIRDSYRDHLGDGMSGPEATQKTLMEYASSFSDPDESGVAWFAPAATQWKLGRLNPETIERTLQLLDSGSDLKRWEGEQKNYRARQAALEKLRAQITSPQPAAKPIKRPVLHEWHLGVGELFAIKLLSGRFIVLRVIGTHKDKGGTYPECELLDWIGDEIPDEETLKGLGFRTSRRDHRHRFSQLMLVGIGKKAAPRLQTLHIHSKPAQKAGPCSVVHWKYLDKFLAEWLLIE